MEKRDQMFFLPLRQHSTQVHLPARPIPWVYFSTEGECFQLKGTFSTEGGMFSTDVMVT
jgi:hypothetical protein